MDRKIEFELMSNIYEGLTKISNQFQIKEDDNKKLHFNFSGVEELGISVIYNGFTFDCECCERMTISNENNYYKWNQSVFFIFEVVAELNNTLIRYRFNKGNISEYLKTYINKRQNVSRDLNKKIDFYGLFQRNMEAV